ILICVEYEIITDISIQQLLVEALPPEDARRAPRRPEVKHERLQPPQNGEVYATATVEASEVERWRSRMVAVVERLRDRRGVLMCDAPDEQREQPDDDCDCECLRSQPDWPCP